MEEAAGRSWRAAEADRLGWTGEAEEGRRHGRRPAEETRCLAAVAPGWAAGGRSGSGVEVGVAGSGGAQVLRAEAPDGCEVEEEGEELQLW